MLSILVGVILPVVSRGARGGEGEGGGLVFRTGTDSWVGAMLSRAWTAETRRAGAGGGESSLWDSAFFFWWGKPVEEKRWSLSAHSEPFLKLSGSHYPNLRRLDTKSWAQKNWLTGTQLIDSCAQNRTIALYLEQTMHKLLCIITNDPFCIYFTRNAPQRFFVVVVFFVFLQLHSRYPSALHGEIRQTVAAEVPDSVHFGSTV